MKSIEELLQSPFVQGMFKGIIGAIVGMVIVTALKMRKKAVKGVLGWGVGIGAFLAMSIFGVPPSVIIVCAIAAGLINVFLVRRKTGEAEK